MFFSKSVSNDISANVLVTNSRPLENSTKMTILTLFILQVYRPGLRTCLWSKEIKEIVFLYHSCIPVTESNITTKIGYKP